MGRGRAVFGLADGAAAQSGWLELLGLDELQALASANVGELAKVGHDAHVLSIEADAHVEYDEEQEEEDEEDDPKLAPALALGGFLAHYGLLSRRTAVQYGWNYHGSLSHHIAGKMRAVQFFEFVMQLI
jgi:hypothetical protein